MSQLSEVMHHSIHLVHKILGKEVFFWVQFFLLYTSPLPTYFWEYIRNIRKWVFFFFCFWMDSGILGSIVVILGWTYTFWACYICGIVSNCGSPHKSHLASHLQKWKYFNFSLSRPKRFTSLKADLQQEINRGFAFRTKIRTILGVAV